jgi:hypothetical protein
MTVNSPYGTCLATWTKPVTWLGPRLARRTGRSARIRRMLATMSLELTIALILLALLVTLDVAALRWGVDSRFIDVRSDF